MVLHRPGISQDCRFNGLMTLSFVFCEQWRVLSNDTLIHAGVNYLRNSYIYADDYEQLSVAKKEITNLELCLRIVGIFQSR